MRDGERGAVRHENGAEVYDGQQKGVLDGRREKVFHEDGGAVRYEK